MRKMGNRVIKINKAKLIETLKANKESHIKEYDKAVMAYQTEADKQLNELIGKNLAGDLNIELNLIKPLNRAENYDKIIEMFEWEIQDDIELTQSEFKEYVQDEFDFAIQAKFANSMYM